MLNESSDASLSAVAFLQVSGLNFTYNRDEEVGLRVVDVHVEVSPGVWEFIDMNKAYSVATIDFLYYGGLGFKDMLAHGTNVKGPGNETVDIIYTNYIGAISPMSPPSEVRISTTSLSRRSCYASNSSTSGDPCSGVGTCQGGVCRCPDGYSGSFCEVSPSSDSSSSSDRTIALAIALPIGLGFLGLLCLGLLLLVLLRRRWESRQAETWMINANELEMQQQLGEGSFGQVWKATWRDQEVAVKMLTNEVNESKAARQSFLNEMRIMSQLRHPNVVLFMAASLKPTMCIVMEFMSLGSLFDVRLPLARSSRLPPMHAQLTPPRLSHARHTAASQRAHQHDPAPAADQDGLPGGQGHALPPLVGRGAPRPQVPQHPARRQVEREDQRLWPDQAARGEGDRHRRRLSVLDGARGAGRIAEHGLHPGRRVQLRHHPVGASDA
jgi:hypothetical protein